MKNTVEVELLKVNEDGSADFVFHLDDSTKELLLIYGIKCAIMNGIKEASEWSVPKETL
jgi:hypothetical protein